jgi:hypothetical protein
MLHANNTARVLGAEAGNIMKQQRLVLSLLAFALSGAWSLGAKAAECYSYEPDKSHVPGTLESRADPQNPEGREILMLITDEPICINGGEDPELNKPEQGIKELQVLYKDPYRIKVLVGKKVQVDGWLFHKDSDEQLTDVLIDAKKIKPASY